MVCGRGGGAAALAGEGVVKVHASMRSGHAPCLHLCVCVCPHPFSFPTCPPYARPVHFPAQTSQKRRSRPTHTRLAASLPLWEPTHACACTSLACRSMACLDGCMGVLWETWGERDQTAFRLRCAFPNETSKCSHCAFPNQTSDCSRCAFPYEPPLLWDGSTVPQVMAVYPMRHACFKMLTAHAAGVSLCTSCICSSPRPASRRGACSGCGCVPTRGEGPRGA